MVLFKYVCSIMELFLVKMFLLFQANFHTSGMSQPGHTGCALVLGPWPALTDGWMGDKAAGTLFNEMWLYPFVRAL